MSTTIEAQATDRWISTVEARHRLGLTQEAFAKLVRRGVFTTRRIPGLRAQVLASEVEKMRRESVHPANAAG